MTYTSDRPLSVDGVRLDTLAWNIAKINRATAGRRTADVVVPGRDGAIPSLNDDLEPVSFGLEMFVNGTDADGAVPAGQTRRDLFRRNLDELVHLFGKRHALLEIQEVVAAGTARRAFAKVTDAITPDLAAHGSTGQFSVGLTIPAGVWEDAQYADWDSGQITAGEPVEVATLRGGTERVTDAVILVQGPVSNPLVRDANTGAYVRLQKALAAGEVWRVNVGTWSTRTGTGLTLDGPDSAGADAQALTTFGGSVNQAAFLPLVPVRDPVDAAPLSWAPDGTPYVTSQAGSGAVVAYDEDGQPYVTYLAETAGQAIAYDEDDTPYLTGGGVTPGGSPVRRTRIVLEGSGVTTDTRVKVRARRKWAL